MLHHFSEGISAKEIIHLQQISETSTYLRYKPKYWHAFCPVGIASRYESKKKKEEKSRRGRKVVGNLLRDVQIISANFLHISCLNYLQTSKRQLKSKNVAQNFFIFPFSSERNSEREVALSQVPLIMCVDFYKFRILLWNTPLCLIQVINYLTEFCNFYSTFRSFPEVRL